jgi:hypothetical protein
MIPKSSILLCFFSWAKDIHKEMFPVYGGKCLLRKAFHSWVMKLSRGRSKVADDARPGRLVEFGTEAAVQREEELIQAGRRLTIDRVATALGCSRILAYSIMHDSLKLREVCLLGAQRTEGSRKNEPNGSVLATSLMVCR